MSDGDVPDWARPLVAGPIELDETTSDTALTNALCERLEALLTLYNCDATPEGWRSLALQLALEREDMKVQVPVDRKPQTGGAEPGSLYWTVRRLKKEIRDDDRKSAKLVAEAEEKRNPHGPSAKRLQNLLAVRKLVKPRWMARIPWMRRIEKAMDRAAALLEASKSQN